ncbi:MAG: M48 family metallopeptidase [Waddliaceae bacterium]
MDFWEAQRKARGKTKLYITAFVMLTLAAAGLVEYLLRWIAPHAYHPSLPMLGLIFLGAVLLVAVTQYLIYRREGGAHVAKSMGGEEVSPDNTQPVLRQLHNIVQEVAISSGQPVPKVFILPSNQINAFAAGTNAENAAVAITVGALNKLNRDEVQAVIGHEFGHIYNRDMKISLQLAAMVMGFYFLLYYGMRLLQVSGMYGTPREYNYGRGFTITSLIAYLFLVGGIFSWFFGSLLKSLVSRQREYLADACSVQFTRNPGAMADALRKIKRDHVSDMALTSMAYSHLFINNTSFFSRLFPTHPPIELRIKAIEGETYKPDRDLM